MSRVARRDWDRRRGMCGLSVPEFQAESSTAPCIVPLATNKVVSPRFYSSKCESSRVSLAEAEAARALSASRRARPLASHAFGHVRRHTLSSQTEPQHPSLSNPLSRRASSAHSSARRSAPRRRQCALCASFDRPSASLQHHAQVKPETTQPNAQHKPSETRAFSGSASGFDSQRIIHTKEGGGLWVGARGAHLCESDLLGALAEALAADVDSVLQHINSNSQLPVRVEWRGRGEGGAHLADETGRVGAHAAEESEHYDDSQHSVLHPILHLLVPSSKQSALPERAAVRPVPGDRTLLPPA